MRITYGKNVYGNEEISAVVKQLKKTTQMSDSVKEFEIKIAKIFKKKYGIMVNSGSSALTLAMDLINIKKGDEIITPALNFGTAITSIIKANAKPIFTDIEIDTLQISTQELKKKITKKTRAVLIPNLIGNIPNWVEIKKIINNYSNIFIIEDSADTLGAKIGKKSTGNFSDISITSFYGSHVISCGGNGGLLLLDNKKFYEKAKVLRSWGRMSSVLQDSENIKKRLGIKLKGIEYDKKFIFSENGYNFEPSEIGAAFGLEQLKKFRNFSFKRNQNFKLHKIFFSKYKDIFIPPTILKNVKTNFLAYPIILKPNKYFTRKELQIYLENNNIQTRPIFSGNALRHPAFSFLISKRNKLSSFKNADYIMKNGILIGCHQGLTVNHIKYIHKIINKFLNKFSR